jgi:hypothetical protein
MDISLDVREVERIEMGEMNESSGGEYYWREITIKTTKGDVRITVYSKDQFDENALKVMA